MTARRAGVLALLAVALAACAAPRPSGAPWEAPLGREHPLAGRIWDAAAGRFIDPEAMAARLAGARFVLLGEQHDNPDHHRLQARLVQALVAAGRRPAVAFEMLSSDQAPALARYLAARPADAAGLGPAVDWSRTGWPEWRLYAPIAGAALAAGLPIVAANIPPATARALARGDRAGLDPGLAARHGLDRPPPAGVEAAMLAEIREAHCGQVPERLLPGMVLAQRVRDAQMADAMLAADGDGAVLIAGAGHARTDRGAPAYIRARMPGAAVASVAFVEVAADRPSPADYAQRFGGGLPFDYVWFTPRAEEDDPCGRFRSTPKGDVPPRGPAPRPPADDGPAAA